MSHMANTGNETRARMVLPPMDFKSIASTIPPRQHVCDSYFIRLRHLLTRMLIQTHRLSDQFITSGGLYCDT